MFSSGRGWQTFGLLLALALIVTVRGSDGDALDETGCPAGFQGKCKCGLQPYANWNNGNDVYVVNCTNSQFTDSTPLEFLPNGTQVLLFNGNNLPMLDWNVFGVWDPHDYLEVVDLSNNKITDILGKTFHKVKNVKRLVLDHNNIKITGRHHHQRLLTNFYSLEELHLTNAFTEVIDSKWYLQDLKDILLAAKNDKLWKLHLEQNEIWSIDKDTFCDLPSLSDLYLGDNQLTDLDFDFQCIKKLRMLDVQRNKIKRLDKQTMKRIDKVFSGQNSKKVNLNYNPWECDCYLVPFVQWVKNTKTKFYRKEKLSCYHGYPEINAGRRIAVLPEADLWCSSDPQGPTHALLTILIILSLMCFVSILVYANRGRLSKMRPLVDNLSSRMQYSTITNAFNDGPNDHADINVNPNQTVTYTLSKSSSMGSGTRIGLTPSTLDPPEAHVWVNPISNSLVGGSGAIQRSPPNRRRNSSQSSDDEESQHQMEFCQGSLGDCHCSKCQDEFYWG